MFHNGYKWEKGFIINHNRMVKVYSITKEKYEELLEVQDFPKTDEDGKLIDLHSKVLAEVGEVDETPEASSYEVGLFNMCVIIVKIVNK